jgi:PadR family transcriptional regulator, regulatory protein AphA
MPAEHAILGQLALDAGAGHGYDLARRFAADAPLGAVLHLESGMLYHHLKKMARSGWVEATTERQGSRPPRQVYRLTEDGETELRRWLAEPVGKTREIRLDFLVKLYFARRLDPALAARLVAEQRETLDRLSASLAEQRAAIDPSASDDAAFTALALDLRIAQTRAALEWLARAE